MSIYLAKLEELSAHNLAIGFEGQIMAEVYGMPRKQIEWLHNKKRVAVLDGSGKMIMNEKDRYQIDVRGSLIIKKVVAEDKGRYDINVLTDESKIESSATIDVGCEYLILLLTFFFQLNQSFLTIAEFFGFRQTFNH